MSLENTSAQQEVNGRTTLNSLPVSVIHGILDELVDPTYQLNEIFGRQACVPYISKAWYDAVLDYFVHHVRRSRATEMRDQPQRDSNGYYSYGRLTYIMTSRSLERMKAVSQNPRLAGLINSVRYLAVDFHQQRSCERAFKEHLERSDCEKSRFIRKSPAGRRKQLDQEYREYLSYYGEHQKLIAAGHDRAALRETLNRFPELRCITFERYSDWLYYRQKFTKYGTPMMLRRGGTMPSLKPLRKPVYWHGFFHLAAAASEIEHIDTLSMQMMVPDLSLTHESLRTGMHTFFQRIVHLQITCVPDTSSTLDSYGRAIPRCRKTDPDQEATAWSSALSNAAEVEILVVEVCRAGGPFAEGKIRPPEVSRLAEIIISPSGNPLFGEFCNLRCLSLCHIDFSITDIAHLLRSNANSLEVLQLIEYGPSPLDSGFAINRRAWNCLETIMKSMRSSTLLHVEDNRFNELFRVTNDFTEDLVRRSDDGEMVWVDTIFARARLTSGPRPVPISSGAAEGLDPMDLLGDW